MLEWKIRKSKKLGKNTLYIFELPTGCYYVIEYDENENIIQARFHHFWIDSLHDFNKIRKAK